MATLSITGPVYVQPRGYVQQMDGKKYVFFTVKSPDTGKWVKCIFRDLRRLSEVRTAKTVTVIGFDWERKTLTPKRRREKSEWYFYVERLTVEEAKPLPAAPIVWPSVKDLRPEEEVEF